MERRVSNLIAHAFTPWDWQSKVAVEVLVVALTVVFGYGVALGLMAGDPWSNRLLVTAVNATIGYLVFLRPGLRSWRRWKMAHPSELEPVG